MFGKLLGTLVSAPFRMAEVASRVVLAPLDDGQTADAMRDVAKATEKGVAYIVEGDDEDDEG